MTEYEFLKSFNKINENTPIENIWNVDFAINVERHWSPKIWNHENHDLVLALYKKHGKYHSDVNIKAESLNNKCLEIIIEDLLKYITNDIELISKIHNVIKLMLNKANDHADNQFTNSFYDKSSLVTKYIHNANYDWKVCDALEICYRNILKFTLPWWIISNELNYGEIAKFNKNCVNDHNILNFLCYSSDVNFLVGNKIKQWEKSYNIDNTHYIVYDYIQTCNKNNGKFTINFKDVTPIQIKSFENNHLYKYLNIAI